MVYMLLADGFEEIEAVYPLDVLRRCGVAIKTVGVSSGDDLLLTGSNGITVKADIALDEVERSGIEMLIIPGGPGRKNIRANAAATDLIRHCCESGVKVAAICGAPEILGELGLLKDRKATCYPGLEGNLGGAEYIAEQAVVTDGNITTSQGAGTSPEFAYALAEQLCGAEKAKEIFGRMVATL